MKANSSSRVLLFIAHNDIELYRGGVQIHVKQLIKKLKNEHSVYFLTRSPNGFLVRHYFKSKMDAEQLKFRWDEYDQIHYRPAEVAFSKFLKDKKISEVHFHHFLNIPWNLISHAKKNCKVTFTMHDYHALCPRYDLLDSDYNFCNFCKKESNCNSYSPLEDYHISPPLISAKDRRQKVAKILSGIEKIVPSENLKQNLIRHLKLKNKNFFVRNPEQCLEEILKNPNSVRSTQIAIAFLGVFSKKKGSEVFKSIVEKLSKKYKNVSWKVIGEVSDYHLAEELMVKYGVEFLGPYNKENLDDLLRSHNIRIGLVLSIWPETYSYTLTELFQSNCIPIATEIGAPGERLKRLQLGWTISTKNPVEDMGMILNSVTKNRKILDFKTLQIQNRNNQYN